LDPETGGRVRVARIRGYIIYPLNTVKLGQLWTIVTNWRYTMYIVTVTYYWESEDHRFDSYDKALECFNNYCKCANTIVTLNGPDVHLSNNKEYLAD
jgi:hypothetical protein